MRISDWSSDVCSSDLVAFQNINRVLDIDARHLVATHRTRAKVALDCLDLHQQIGVWRIAADRAYRNRTVMQVVLAIGRRRQGVRQFHAFGCARSEERRVGKDCVSTWKSRGMPFT